MSKLDTLKKLHPEWDVSIFDLLKKADPSESNRYVEFLFRCFKLSTPEKMFEKLIAGDMDELRSYHQYYERGLINNKDISQYSNFKEIIEENEIAREKLRLKELEKSIVVLHEDNDWFIIRPESYQAAAAYGANTRWCITNKTYWNQYAQSFYYIFIINKLNQSKYVISKNIDHNQMQIWNAEDKEINLLKLPLPLELINLIIKELSENNIAVQKCIGTKVKSATGNIYWHQSNGVSILVDSMSTEHMKNCVKKFDGVQRYAPAINRMKELISQREPNIQQDIIDEFPF